METNKNYEEVKKNRKAILELEQFHFKAYGKIYELFSKLDMRNISIPIYINGDTVGTITDIRGWNIKGTGVFEKGLFFIDIQDCNLREEIILELKEYLIMYENSFDREEGDDE